MNLDDNALLYRYRLLLTGHHAVVVLSDIKDIDEFDMYLQGSIGANPDHMEKFVCVDTRLNLSDLKVKVNSICVIERPWGDTPIKLADIRRKTSTLNENPPPKKVSIGQKVKR